MPVVETARGAVDSAELGQVLMHEHVFILTHEFLVNFPHVAGWDEDAEVEKAVARMDEIVAEGIGTIVDLTVTGLGRDVALLQRVAERTALNIVVATGHYTFTEVPNFIRFRGGGSVDSMAGVLASWFVRDITEGIAGTGVKAGILKCATDAPGVTPDVEAVIRACARAHRETGTPISTHTHAGLRRGLEQQDVLESEGVDLSRVVIGHCGDSTDLDYLTELIRRGSYIGMDRFGLEQMVSFDDRVQTVVDLCDRGHADRLVLSHDTFCYSDWFGPRPPAGHWHYRHISQDVLPELERRGVSTDQIRLMMVENPRRIFETTKPY